MPVGTDVIVDAARADEAGGGAAGGDDSSTSASAAAGTADAGAGAGAAAGPATGRPGGGAEEDPTGSSIVDLRSATYPQRTPQPLSRPTSSPPAHGDADRPVSVLGPPSCRLLSPEMWAAIDAGKYTGTNKSHGSAYNPAASSGAIAAAVAKNGGSSGSSGSGGISGDNSGVDKGGDRLVVVEDGAGGGGALGGRGREGGGNGGGGGERGERGGGGGGGRKDGGGSGERNGSAGGVVEGGDGEEASLPCRFELSEEEIKAAGRLSESDFLRAHVEGLVLRCVNADPNYGSMWFHCRHRPSDTAKYVTCCYLRFCFWFGIVRFGMWHRFVPVAFVSFFSFCFVDFFVGVFTGFHGFMIRPAGRVRRFPKSRGSSRVGSGRVGSGRVGSGRVGSGRVRSFYHYHRLGRVGSP